MSAKKKNILWTVKKSKVHGMGVFAKANIKKGSKIIQYIGDKVTKKEGDKRSEARIKRWEKSKKIGSVYIFELNKRYDIDGYQSYNKAKYINHSCTPNCEVDIIRGEIWISSIKNINIGDELSYNYGYEFDKDDFKDHKCKCGSSKCIGYIIAADQRHKLKRLQKKIRRGS